LRGSSDKLSQAASRYRAGRFREAEALLREVLAENPESPDALFFLGSIAADAGRRHDALAELGRLRAAQLKAQDLDREEASSGRRRRRTGRRRSSASRR